MATKVKKNKINFKGKTVNIGIDMHKISWRITALVEGVICPFILSTYPSRHPFSRSQEFVDTNCLSFS